MHLKLIFAGAAVGALLAGSAVAQPLQQAGANYVQLSLGSGVAGRTKLSVSGLGSGHEDLDAGFFAGGAVGRQLSDRVSLEGELLYLKNDIDTDDLTAAFGGPLNASVRTVGGMINARYAVTPIGPLTLGVGAGVGYGKARYKLLGASDSESGFMWQALADVAYPMNDKLTWNLQYRYVRSPDFKDTAVVSGVSYRAKLETGVHVVAAGAQVKF